MNSSNAAGYTEPPIGIRPQLSADEHKLVERIAGDASKRLEQDGGVKKRLPKSITLCGFIGH